MLCKDRSVVLDRMALLDNGRDYPDEFGISLPSQFYLDQKPAASLTVLKNTGIIPFSEVMQRLDEFEGCKIGDSFGPTWTTHWFKVVLQVPSDWLRDFPEIHFIWNAEGEGMIYNTKGKPVQGLTGEQSDRLREEHIIYKKNPPRNELDRSGKVTYYIELSCTGMVGCFKDGNMMKGLDLTHQFELSDCRIAVFNRPAWDLYWDFKIIYESAKHLDTSQQSRSDDALMIGNKIMNVCEPKDVFSYPPSRELAKQFFDVKNPTSQHKIYAVGHCHIDMAWLWPFSETRRKGGRSWSSQTELMKLYSPFSFCASSSGLYEWVKNDYPLLFEEIKQYAKIGRFLPVGGSYLEFDGYVPAGESMARQMLYGQRFFKENFGAYCNTFFLPDTFGYSAQLPQIIRKAGMKYFLTQKLSWSRFNTFPHTSFNWKGIDGTSVLTHFPPADTYCAAGSVEEVLKSQTNFKDKGRSNTSLMLFGVGDGGGGPMDKHIEQLERMKDTDGLPKVVLGGSVDQFFDELQKDSEKLMTWDGELYLELHNGTYTTMANNKKYNRTSEFLIRDTELFATIVCALEKSNTRYNATLFADTWRKIMLFQFHDVLPGTCIGPVYEVTEREYPALQKALRDDLTLSLDALIARIVPHAGLKDDPNTVFLFNSLQFDRENEVLEWTRQGAKAYSAVSLPGLGCAVYPQAVLEQNIIKTQITFTEKENVEVDSKLLHVTLSKGGRLLSVKDKDTQEYFDPDTMKESIGKWGTYAGGNILLLHDDVPIYWDAWDLWIYYQESSRELKATGYSVENLPHQCRVQFSYTISESSSMTQTVVVNAFTKRIDFETQVDWHEEHKILRTYFPLNVRTDFATCDIQNGSLRRPTSSNTSWEVAKYEVCSHKFVDMSEGSYGVALLNNCKYGYSARGNVMGMSLLKSSKGPHDKADMGVHTFVYSLFPHKSITRMNNLLVECFAESKVPEEAFRLNVPTYQRWASTALSKREEFQYIKLDKPNVVLDALKLDEETKKNVIMRVHENLGTSTNCCTKCCFELLDPHEVNILEERPAGEERKLGTRTTLEGEEEEEYEIVGKEDTVVVVPSTGAVKNADKTQVFLALKPFEIVTLKLN